MPPVNPDFRGKVPDKPGIIGGELAGLKALSIECPAYTLFTSGNGRQCRLGACLSAHRCPGTPVTEVREKVILRNGFFKGFQPAREKPPEGIEPSTC